MRGIEMVVGGDEKVDEEELFGGEGGDCVVEGMSR